MHGTNWTCGWGASWCRRERITWTRESFPIKTLLCIRHRSNPPTCMPHSPIPSLRPSPPLVPQLVSIDSWCPTPPPPPIPAGLRVLPGASKPAPHRGDPVSPSVPFCRGRQKGCPWRKNGSDCALKTWPKVLTPIVERPGRGGGGWAGGRETGFGSGSGSWGRQSDPEVARGPVLLVLPNRLRT
jgi:hypothetical protein